MPGFESIRGSNPRWATEAISVPRPAFQPTPEFYSDMGAIWDAIRGSADVAGLAMGVPSPRSFTDLVRFLARQQGRRRPSAVPDLEQEGMAAALKRFGTMFPGTSGEVLAGAPGVPGAVTAKEPLGRKLGSTARGAMKNYLSAQEGEMVAEPAYVLKRRSAINKLESTLEQRLGPGISDEAIAKGLKLDPREVSQLRANRGYSVPLEKTDPETKQSTPRLIKAPKETIPGEAPEPAGPSIDDMKSAIAKTDKQRAVLELYLQGVPGAEIGRRLGIKQPNIVSMISDFAKRGKQVPKETP